MYGRRRRERQRPSPSARGYGARWRRLRRLKLNRDPLCERCLAAGCVEQAALVHHTEPISGGGKKLPALEDLESLCRPCHAAVHKEEDADGS